MLLSEADIKMHFSISLFCICGEISGVISGLILLFEHLPCWVSEIEHFEIFSLPQENKITQRFFIKFYWLSHFLMLGVFYAYREEYKHNDCFFTNLHSMYTKFQTSKCLWLVCVDMIVVKWMLFFWCFHKSLSKKP